jgi:hypothetical protein
MMVQSRRYAGGKLKWHFQSRTWCGKPSRPSREATSTGCSASRRLERHGVFISHITDGKPIEAWRKS